MSLFGKTVVVRGGMSLADVEVLLEGLQEFAKVIRDRLDEQDARIEKLECEVSRLKQEPRVSFRQKLKARTG